MLKRTVKICLENSLYTHRLRRCSEIRIKILYYKIRSWRMNIVEGAEQFTSETPGRIRARQIYLLMKFRVLQSDLANLFPGQNITSCFLSLERTWSTITVVTFFLLLG